MDSNKKRNSAVTESKEKEEFTDGSLDEESSEEGKSSGKERQTSWIYRLTKAEIQKKLTELEVPFDNDAPFDRLRKTLVKSVKNLARRQGTPKQEDTQPTTMALGTNSKVLVKFNLEEDDWEIFVERLEFHFIACDIPDEKKSAVLLTRLEVNAYNLLRNLATPIKLKDLSFNELSKLMLDHLAPPPSEVAERAKFAKTTQKQGRSIAEFVAELRLAARYCEFSNSDERLRDQFIAGVRDKATKVELYRQKPKTFSDAVTQATSFEAENNNAESAIETPTNAGVHHVARGGRGGRGGINTRGGRGRTPERQRQQGANTSAGKTAFCFCCGRSGHETTQCRFRNYPCHRCGQRGHLKVRCNNPTKTMTIGNLETSEKEEEDGDTEDNSEDDFQYDHGLYTLDAAREDRQPRSINRIRDCVDPQYVKIFVNGTPLRMELDSGAAVATMSRKDKEKYFPTVAVEEQDQQFRVVGGALTKPSGVMRDLEIEYNGVMEKGDCYIVDGETPLLGRPWMKKLGMWPWPGLALQAINEIDTKEDLGRLLKRKFPKLFDEGTGTFNRGKVSIQVKPGTQPKFSRPRPLPLALIDRVSDEIDRLVSRGVLKPVDSSEWATPIVPVLKKTDGSVRIRGDFKTTLNPSLVIKQYPLPRKELLFRRLAGGVKFTKIDLKNAYQQVLLEENCQKFVTINTHKGLFRYTRMPFEISSAPAEFQNLMDKLTADLPNAQFFLDDALTTGKTKTEHYNNVISLCQRLEECGLKVDKGKCSFFQEKIEYFGFMVDKEGVHQTEEAVEAIRKAPRPRDVKQLQSFLGSVTVHDAYIENRAHKLQPLYKLLHNKSKWQWSDECEKAFIRIKEEMISPKVLAHYDPGLELILPCDASAYGVGAALTQRDQNKRERPIAFASRTLSTAEAKYAPIHREAVAIIYGVTKFYIYLYARHFTLRTDHKPLTLIFGPKKGIPIIAANRLQRWALFLTAFQYTVEYVTSKKNALADALSRLPLPIETVDGNKAPGVAHIKILETSGLIDAQTVAKASKHDVVCNQVKRAVLEGWPREIQKLDTELSKYYSRRNELSNEEDCLLWRARVVIPRELRAAILEELHASHFGIVRMKQIARSYLWWPSLDNDIEEIVKSCEACLEKGKTPPRVTLTPWRWPEQAWFRIHADFLAPFHGLMFLVVIDVHSKWPEVANMRKNTTTEKTIEAFKEIFARHGLPFQLVTDNGTAFTSSKFREFVERLRIKHTFTPPHHPASNGAAENLVGTFKDKVDKMIRSGKNLDDAVQTFLFDYRTTPHATTGATPASLLYKRELRTRFSLLRPHIADRIEKQQAAQVKNSPKGRNVNFEVGERVRVRDYSKNAPEWSSAIVTENKTPVTHVVRLSGGTSKRHSNQMRKCSQESSEKEKPATENKETGTMVPRRSRRRAANASNRD